MFAHTSDKLLSNKEIATAFLKAVKTQTTYLKRVIKDYNKHGEQGYYNRKAAPDIEPVKPQLKRQINDNARKTIHDLLDTLILLEGKLILENNI